MSYALRLDLDRCVGCMACAVACMDQNDLEVSAEPIAWRQVFTVESGAYPEARLRYISMACMHCEDAPCRVACPTGAISRDAATHAVQDRRPAMHRVPQLFDCLSVRGTPLRPGRDHAEVRPVQRPPRAGFGASVRSGLPEHSIALR
jgi:ferredoxin